MTATNHALTGALIGLTVHNPWVALPAAFVSHIICDIIPHFGANPDWIKQRSFKQYLMIDAFGCFLVVLLLLLFHPAYWLLACFCAFVATTPDFLWIPKFLAESRGKKFVANSVQRFLGAIQWFQKPSGALVEAVWFVGAAVLLWQFL